MTDQDWRGGGFPPGGIRGKLFGNQIYDTFESVASMLTWPIRLCAARSTIVLT